MSGKGSKFDVEGVEFEFNTLYLDIPVNALAKFQAGNAGKFYIGGGPYLGFKLSSKVSVGDESEDIENWKSTDFGVNFATGFEFSQGLTLGVNYGLGLTNIIEGDDETTGKNKVFAISLGYLF